MTEHDAYRDAAAVARADAFASAFCRRPFVAMAVGFAAGTGTAWVHAFPVAAAGVLAATCAAAATALALTYRPRASCCAVAASFVLLGAAWCTAGQREAGRVRSMLGGASDRVVVLGGVVRSVTLGDHLEAPVARPSRLLVDVDVAFDGPTRRATDFALSVSCAGKAPSLLPGDRLEFCAILGLPQPARYPGGYDRRAALATEGVYLQAQTPGETIRVVKRGAALAPRRIAARARRRLAEGLRATLPYRDAELCVALLLGHRTGVDPADRDHFTASGLGHVLAVSGLHVAILAGLVGWGLRRCRVPWLAAAIVLAALVGCYALVAGARPPVVRSAIMIVVYLGATVIGRERDGASSVAFAAFVLLVACPESLRDAGFQMSFAAVVFLTFLYPIAEEAYRALRGTPDRWMDPLEENRLERVAAWLRRAAFASAAAWIGVQPLLSHYLGVFNPWAVLSNVVMLPVVTYALAAAVGLALVAATSLTAGALVAPLARLALGALTTGVEAFARLPWSSVRTPSPGVGWLIAYYVAAMGLFAWARIDLGPHDRPTYERAVRWARRSVRIAAICAVCFAVAAWAVHGWVSDCPPAPSLTVLDLGSSRAALLRASDGSSIVVNAGAPGARRAMARHVIDAVRNHLSAVALTRDSHETADGLQDVVESGRPGVVVLPHSGRSGRSEGLLRAAGAARGLGSLVMNASGGDVLSTASGTALRWCRVDRGRRPVNDVTVVECLLGDGLAVTLVDDASVRAVAGVTDVRCDTSVRGGVLVILGVGRADDVVRTVADRVRPEAVVLCASRTELAFTGPARLAQVLGEAGFAVHVTGVLGSLRVATASGRLRLSAWDGEHWVTID